MDHAAGPQCDHEERVHGTEQGVRDREEVAGPGLAGVVAQERRPTLARPLRRASRMYFWTVHLATRISSLSSSPRIRAAAHKRLVAASSRMSAIVSTNTLSLRSTGPGRDVHRQHRRNGSRCQRSRVSGRTITRAKRHARTRLANTTGSARSVGVRRGHAMQRRRMTRCWRSSAFPPINSGSLRRRSASDPVRNTGLLGFVTAARRRRGACRAAWPVLRTRRQRQASIRRSVWGGREHSSRTDPRNRDRPCPRCAWSPAIALAPGRSIRLLARISQPAKTAGGPARLRHLASARRAAAGPRTGRRAGRA